MARTYNKKYEEHSYLKAKEIHKLLLITNYGSTLYTVTNKIKIIFKKT